MTESVVLPPRNRLVVIIVVMFFSMLAMLARAIDLQVMDHEFLQEKGAKAHLRIAPIMAVRGTIIDRNGEALAVSTPVKSVAADPGDLLQDPDAIRAVARLLEVDADGLQSKLAQRAQSEFVWLRRRLNPDTVEQLLELDAPGIFTKDEYKRYYPTGQISSQLLGYTNIDDQGLEGLEYKYNDWLRGEPGLKRVIIDDRKRQVEEVELIQSAQHGHDLQLTIDRRLQYLAFRELQLTIEKHQAKSGSVVLMDVENGEILAMANYPAFNPNQLSSLQPGAQRNRAVTDVFEPGSVMKPLSVLAALEAGIAKPHTVIEIEAAGLRVGGHTIKDTHYYGPLTVSRIITKSSNIGMSKLALRMEGQQMYNTLRRFGFGQLTGVVFPGESAGVLRDHQRWRPLEQATLSYGHGMAATTLQLTQAYAAIANGGRLYQPTLIKGDTKPPASVVDPELIEQLIPMLESVTGSEGTGKRAAIPMYRVAGKTGTAHKASVGGYSEDRYISSFVGFAPASRPRLACAVVIHEPSNGEYYGGLVAAPVFQVLMQDALRMLDVAPDALGDIRLARERGTTRLDKAFANSPETPVNTVVSQ